MALIRTPEGVRCHPLARSRWQEGTMNYATTDLHLAIAHQPVDLFARWHSRPRDRRYPPHHDVRRHQSGRTGGFVVRHPCRSHHRGRAFAGNPRCERLGVLLSQRVLLGENGGFCRGRAALDCADKADHQLAAGAGGRMPHSLRPQAIFSRSGAFCGPRWRSSP
jgi:hypothetical protein